MKSEKRSKHPFNLYLTSGEYMKVIGSQDGYFPDFGHHVANEMGGVWLHPIKLLDGFWLRVTDPSRGISVWARADEYATLPWGNTFRYDHGLGHIPVSIERVQFAPETEKGLVVRYEIYNSAAAETALELELLARTDLRPVWHSETIGVVDGPADEARALSSRLALAKDGDHDWYACVGTDLPGEQYSIGGQLYGPEFTSGNGAGISFRASVALAPGERFVFHLVVSGSTESGEACERTYRLLEDPAERQRLLEEKQAAYEAIRARASLEIEGDPDFCDVFAWAKWNTQWLVQRVDGIGRGLTAGSPTYPWWFGCDNAYALQGVLAVGDHRLALETAKLLLEFSKRANGNGRIIHEATTMGVVANPGNTQETAHYICLVWELYRWTGDRTVLEDNYEACGSGMDWLLGEMDPDGDGLPSGYGIIEIAGLNMELIDSAAYTAAAAGAMSRIAAELGAGEEAAAYAVLEKRLTRAVNETFWDEREGLFCDAVAPKKDLLPKVDDIVSMAERHGAEGVREALERQLSETEGLEADRGWLIQKNWVISTPMEAGVADRAKGERAVRNMRNEAFVGEYGSYLSAVLQQGTMTISTGAHAVAEARYGDPEAALELLRRMNRSFSTALPGSICEMSPDYGCIAQAWTLYALAVPVVMHLIGLQPEAHRRRVRLEPKVPASWEGRWIRLRDARVGDASLDIALRKEGGKLAVEIVNASGLTVVVSWNGRVVESAEADIRFALDR
ncbi:glycogen debranching protein [Paenibacillus antri]|uniref:Glycogen debranching protein n=1 Tax=Paenibacillus antri TaxID=2582848 RepID=A0A5R9GA90_9BACL|nr:family 78 glycoside hydrolase catalytic domain [Paenibacillus antri]TLS51276.1 glycogen debranching protein [Paenibacillus antri]